MAENKLQRVKVQAKRQVRKLLQYSRQEMMAVQRRGNGELWRSVYILICKLTDIADIVNMDYKTKRNVKGNCFL